MECGSRQFVGPGSREDGDGASSLVGPKLSDVKKCLQGGKKAEGKAIRVHNGCVVVCTKLQSKNVE